MLRNFSKEWLIIPINVEKVYYWNKGFSSLLVEQARYNVKYKPVFDKWFKKLRELPKEN